MKRRGKERFGGLEVIEFRREREGGQHVVEFATPIEVIEKGDSG